MLADDRTLSEESEEMPKDCGRISDGEDSEAREDSEFTPPEISAVRSFSSEN